MRKHLLAMASLGVLMMTACSSEEPMMDGGNDGVVTFKVDVPQGMQTRAYGEATTATELRYVVYDQTNGEVVINETTTDRSADLTYSVTMNLVKGKTYDFVFWAQDPSCTAYTFDATNKKVTVSYEGAKVNDDTRDAFYNVVSDLTVNGGMNRTVELRRPFAQINVGTSDIEAAKAVNTELASTALSVEGAYTDLDLFSGKASNAVTAAFAADAPATDETFPYAEDGKDYEYLAMAYVLTGTELEGEDVQHAQSELFNVDVTMNFKDGKSNTIEVDNAPVQRNYRTNIFGALLTSPLNWNVIIKPAFYEPDYNTVSNAEELVKALSKGGDIKLYGDIEMPNDGKNGCVVVAGGKEVNLDLNGHTLIMPDYDTNGATFGVRADGEGTKLTISNGTIQAGKNLLCVSAGNGATVTINGGTFIGNTSPNNDGALECIYAFNGSKIIINDGYFKSMVARDKSKIVNPNCPDYGWYYVVNKYNPSKDEIIINGGTFENYNPAWGDDADAEGKSFLGEGHTVEKTVVDGKELYTVK